MLGRVFAILLVLGLLAAAAVFGVYVRLQHWSQEEVPLAGETIFDFKAGTGLSGLSKTLEARGVVSNALMFTAWVRLEGTYRQFQAGRYRFEGKVSPAQVADAIRKGETWNPVVLQIAVPEGFTIKGVIERLAAHGVGHIVELQRLVKDPTFLKSLNVDAPSLEGYLFPATYSFHEMPTAMQALEQMTKTFWQNLPRDYEKRVNAMGLTLQQAVTFASLIELETMLDDEKPLISEVIWRRLKDKVPLAIDAAVIYGIPDYDGDIKWSHLSDASNPYNTRIHVGLPPTPIGAPGLKALEAVLTPSNFGYYYYVLVPGATRHHFSKTLKEHNQHVKKLLNGSKKKASK